MPKSSKRRKEKAADFVKAKLKLGKGKQAASNAVDTSFKARSIALPSQSIVVEKDDSAPTTRRKLSLDDLLVNIKHHNPGTRKDTMFGFRELLDAHWELVDSSLPVLIKATVRVISDEDASVRKALLSFYSWLIPRIPKDDLIPHAPLILLFTTSAQTHIFPEIRIDAVRFLNIFLEHFPKLIVSGWDSASNSHGSRILEGYLGILSAGTIMGEAEGPPVATSTASVMLTPGSKLVVLQSLARFLEVATKSQSIVSISDTAWYLLPYFTSEEAYTAFNRLLQPFSHSQTSPSKAWSPEMDPEFDNFPPVFTKYAGDSSYQLQELSDTSSPHKNFHEAGVSSSSGTSFLAHLATTLHQTLVSVFLDCAASVFSPSNGPPETEMGLVLAVVSVTRTLYGTIIQEGSPVHSAMEELKSILGYMAPYFPFSPSGRKDIKIEQNFQELNLFYCDLTSRLALAYRTQSTSHQATSRGAKGSLGIDPLQSDRVHEYVLQILLGQTTSSQLVRNLTPAAYNSLLPTIWYLINYSGHNEEYSERSRYILQATVEHAMKTGSKSVLKRPTFDFVARLVLLETDVCHHGTFRLGTSAEVDKVLEEWLTQLPQVLWELGASMLSTSEAIVVFLLRLLQRRSRLVHENTLASLQARLAPYFHFIHPTRGAIRGPFAKLPKHPDRDLASEPGLDLGHRFLDVAIVLCAYSSPSGKGTALTLTNAVDHALVGSDLEEYWAHLKRCFLLKH